MKKLVSKLGVFLVMILLIGNVFTSNAVFADTKVFSDVDYTSDNVQAISYLKDNKIVQGYGDGTFKPGNKINRAEFLKIVMEASDTLNTNSLEMAPHDGFTNCFKDVQDQWYASYVCVAAKQKLIKGYDDGYFRPEQEINFAEASKIIANVLKLDVPSAEDGDTWYKPYVSALSDQFAIPTDVGGFGYDITRGQMAEMVWRIKTKPGYVKAVGYDTLQRREVAASTGGKLENFNSCLDLKDYLQENSRQNPHVIMYDAVPVMAPTTAAPAPTKSAAPESAGSAATSSAAPDYSTTNIQVQGVDEADIVKNDGQYIYMVKGSTVRVVQAYPVSSMVELDKVKFDDETFSPSDMYVDGNRLVVIGSVYSSLWDKPYVNQKMGMMPIIGDNYYYGSVTKMYIFDISDRSKITKLRDLTYEGSYTSSRKIGNMVYLVLNKPEFKYVLPAGWGEHDVVPLYEDSSVGKTDVVTKCENIIYLPGSNSTNYIVLAGVPIDTADGKTVNEVVLGSTGDVYASTKNLYVAEAKYPWFYYGNNVEKEQTEIHKFSLSPDEIKYLGKSDVPGHIINQFSMDENGDYFRIATTLGNLWDTLHPATNNVYVLNADLKQVGQIEGIAPGEEIYSVRFVGNRVYMVTFKKTDPFFVIDLSDATNPKILGKLKIPGFSDYLHPYDENHIIGFGKEAVDASEEEIFTRDLNFAWYQGLKIAMFDVTDVSNPVEMFKATIGDRGSSTPVLYDHKALLFDKAKGLMALPVTVAEIPQKLKDDPKTPANTYGDVVFQGAYVYNVSLDKGFELKGKITHYDPNEVKDKAGYYWYGDSDISRILYIGENLYTVSQAMIKANLIDGLGELKSVKLAQ